MVRPWPLAGRLPAAAAPAYRVALIVLVVDDGVEQIETVSVHVGGRDAPPALRVRRVGSHHLHESTRIAVRIEHSRKRLAYTTLMKQNTSRIKVMNESFGLWLVVGNQKSLGFMQVAVRWSKMSPSRQKYIQKQSFLSESK